jgi:hypothetical protein
MNTFRIVLLFLITCADCRAQADFRFNVFDETKNDKLHFEFAQDITIYDSDSQKPRLIYSTEYSVYGINQEKFTYTTESYAGDLSKAEYAAILARARKLPLSGIDSKNKIEDAARSFGWITLNGEDHTVTATPDKEIRKQWQTFLDEFLAANAPAKQRKVTRRTLEGETVKPREIDFATLFKSPKKYDGKRIKITGFYHGEFEGSSFAPTSKGIQTYDKALWLGGSSSFADPKRICGLNDVTLTVEGTFISGPGAHMGLWMGELVRVTESKSTK